MPSPSETGARAELAVATALVRGGYQVYLPFFGAHGRVDLVCEDLDGALLRVQVKSSRVRGDVLMFSTCSNTSQVRRDYRGEADVFGVYSPELDAVFLVPVIDAPSRGCHLRLGPARNGQSVGVRFADEYRV